MTAHGVDHIPVKKAEPKACALCETPTRHVCRVCHRAACATCTLRDEQGRCPGCAA